ncbi:MAG: rhamnulose-1-phosphate aldolase [Clostridiales Family XIII bacterium]|jgi:rhamnulose-1-phosphate aldolase|nr:rhamnulose-1-phosphate aldolase [Clostridiales Family XIII bacterium]
MSKISVIDSPWTQEMIEVTSNLYRLGWDERNGGNVSYLLREEEVSPYVDLANVTRTIAIPFDAASLVGKYFIVTGSGKYFKNVAKAPADNLGLIRVTADGSAVELLWGFEDGGVPTSELPSHFMSHISRLTVDPEHRVIMHTHATHLIAMSFTQELDERSFTRKIWQMCSESLVVMPDGIGIIPWLVPGTLEIGKATAEKFKETRLVLWPHHGMYGSGKDMDEVFGLIETAEKSAEIYTYVQAQGGAKQTITDSELVALAASFQVVPKVGYLE